MISSAHEYPLADDGHLLLLLSGGSLSSTRVGECEGPDLI